MKAVMLVLLLMTTCAQAQLRPRHRFAVTGEQVTRALAKALAEQGYTGEPKLALLSSVTATEAEPVLEVRSVVKTSGARTAVRVACKAPGVCLPFYAMVSSPDGAWRKPVAKDIAKTVAPVMMRAGAPAVMLLDDGRARVSMSVVSLDSGAVGRTIRVATTDRKRVYRAEVVSAGLVRGSF